MWIAEVTTIARAAPSDRSIGATSIASSRVDRDVDSSRIRDAGTPSSTSASRMTMLLGACSGSAGSGPPEAMTQSGETSA